MKAKEVLYYNGRYKGSLSDEACEKLERIITLDKNNGFFEDLKSLIKDLSENEIDDVIKGLGKGQTQLFKTGEMTDMQTLGVGFMFYAENCILGDSVGFGKTIEVAGLYNLLRLNNLKANKSNYKFLMLTEKNLLEQIRRKMVRFTGLRADVLTGERADVEKYIKGNPADNLVGSHSLFNQNIFWEWVRNQQEKFQLLIVDESSVLGNLKTDISKNAKEVLGLFERVIFLNATPFEAKLNTFYSQLSLLDDSLLPVKTKFEKEYCKFDYRGMYPKPTGKYKNQDKFRWLTGYRYFARTRKAKGGVKADCESKVITVPVSKVQREWLKKSQMTQLVYDCPCAFDESIEFNADNVPKIGGLQKLLENDCKNADSILVFVHYKQAQTYISDWLTEQNYTNRVLCGDTKDNERYGIIDDFKNKKFKILITNVQKGLDFGDCDYCIFYGFDPNPSKMVQFEGRMTRSFDIIGKQVYLLCGEGKETERLNKVIKVRAGAMADFTKTDISCIMDLLLEDL